MLFELISSSLSCCLSYHPPFPAGLPGFIQCPCRTVLDKVHLFNLRLLVHVKENVTDEVFLTPRGMSRVSCSSNVDGRRFCL